MEKYTIIVTTRWILERICLKIFDSFITIKIRWREIFNRDSWLFARCFVKAVKRDQECIVFVFKQMWSNFSYRNWFRSELIIYLKFIDFINIIFTLRLLTGYYHDYFSFLYLSRNLVTLYITTCNSLAS